MPKRLAADKIVDGDEKKPFRYEANDLDRAKIEALCATGCPQRMISWYLKRDIKTLRSHYPEEFETARIERNGAVEYALFYQSVMLNNTQATIYYLKCLMPEKYSDKSKLNEDDQAVVAQLMASRFAEIIRAAKPKPN